MKKLTLFMICGCAWAQGLNRPVIGKIIDSNGSLRSVFGIAASFSLGDPEAAVLSAGCSNDLCLWKTETSLVSASGAVDAPAGPALFAFDGANAFVWFSQSRQLAQWQNGALTFVDVSVDGEVLSIRANGGFVQFAVRRRTGVWIVNQDGGAVGALPRSIGPVMLIPGGAVYLARGELVVGSARFPLEGVTAFSQMSGSYLQVRANGVDYALLFTIGQEALFQLPGVPQ
jgi:hypothetical protein